MLLALVGSTVTTFQPSILILKTMTVVMAHCLPSLPKAQFIELALVLVVA